MTIKTVDIVLKAIHGNIGNNLFKANDLVFQRNKCNSFFIIKSKVSITTDGSDVFKVKRKFNDRLLQWIEDCIDENKDSLVLSDDISEDDIIQVFEHLFDMDKIKLWNDSDTIIGTTTDSTIYKSEHIEIIKLNDLVLMVKIPTVKKVKKVMSSLL